ncbi:hypothetical protein FD09_GL002490 [Schleiferilactobacillus perolens DSM 12744]|uniref:Uncharacterized protein n=1 Tax=Schleiferilactobacillus perolens DSM 12744 TaxID=1423792 RepID=A0A0R1MXQ6_9LACO|nr:hypothetical protein FD09_GL002490 [Schleiferilactobacillus perolens DSM 12744]
MRPRTLRAQSAVTAFQPHATEACVALARQAKPNLQAKKYTATFQLKTLEHDGDFFMSADTKTKTKRG